MSGPLLLRSFTTMKIGGTAEQVVWAKDLAADSRLLEPIRILGNGSNILIDDRGLKGSVIITREQDPTEPDILREDDRSAWVKVTAGFYLPSLAQWALKKGLSGCEYMVAIPGTAGGALVQNAGANEQDFSMIFESAHIFNVKTGDLQSYSKSDCHLSYRHSTLKENPQLLVRDLTLRLRKADAKQIKERMQSNLMYRKTKTPLTKASLGSVYTRIPNGDGWLYPGKLIEDAGLKGLRQGGAVVSDIHANYIVNEGYATFEDVIFLMREIEKRVLQNSGVTLQREIVIWSDRDLTPPN